MHITCTCSGCGRVQGHVLHITNKAQPPTFMPRNWPLRPLPQAETPVHVCENERCKPIVHLLLLPQIPKRPLKSLRRRHLPVAGRKQGHSGGSTRTMLCVGPSTSQPASSQAILCADQLETKADPAPGVELLLRPTPGRTGCGQTLWDKAPREFLPFSGQA